MRNRGGRIEGSFRLRNSNVTTANVIRRAIQTLTPSVGFRTEPYERSDVKIVENTSPLVDDMLAHRLGMTPVCADPTDFDPSAYEFRLDVSNEGTTMKDVTTSDIQVFVRDPEDPSRMVYDEAVSKLFFPPDPISGQTILLTSLRPQWNPTAPKEKLKFVAKASISTGKENSRYSPVSQISYGYTKDTDPKSRSRVLEHWLRTQKKLRTEASLTEQERKGIAEKTIAIALWETTETSKQVLLEREFETMEIQRCYLTDEKGEPNDFTFHIESIGVQPIPMIVEAGLKACEDLVSQYADLDKHIPANVRIQQGDSRFPTMDVIFQEEGHTLGNLLETHLCEQNIENEAAELPLTYVAYKVPHPLRAEMFVRMGVASPTRVDVETQKEAAREAVAAACRELRDQFQSLRARWVEMLDPIRAAIGSSASSSASASGAATAPPSAEVVAKQAQAAAAATEGPFNFAF